MAETARPPHEAAAAAAAAAEGNAVEVQLDGAARSASAGRADQRFPEENPEESRQSRADALLLAPTPLSPAARALSPLALALPLAQPHTESAPSPVPSPTRALAAAASSSSPLRSALAARLRNNGGAESPVGGGSSSSNLFSAVPASPGAPVPRLAELGRTRSVTFDDRASASSVRTFYASDPALVVNPKYQLRTLAPLLMRPRRPIETSALARARGVVLEAATFVYPVLSGTIVVRDIAYEKHVFVRLSADEWRTTRDVDAQWLEVAAEPGLERFRFQIDLTAEYRAHATLRLCIGYESGGESLWDNRFGANYSAEMISETLYREFVQDHPDMTGFVAPGRWGSPPASESSDDDDSDAESVGQDNDVEKEEDEEDEEQDDEDDDEDEEGESGAKARALRSKVGRRGSGSGPGRSLLGMGADEPDLFLRPPPASATVRPIPPAASVGATPMARPAAAVTANLGFLASFGARSTSAVPAPAPAAASSMAPPAAAYPPKRLSLDSDSRDDYGDLFGGRAPPQLPAVRPPFAVPAVVSPVGAVAWHTDPGLSWGAPPAGRPVAGGQPRVWT